MAADATDGAPLVVVRVEAEVFAVVLVAVATEDVGMGTVCWEMWFFLLGEEEEEEEEVVAFLTSVTITEFKDF